MVFDLAIINNGADVKLKIQAAEKYADSFFNIEPALTFIPNWYRTSPSMAAGSHTELSLSNPSVVNATYKKCIPFFDAMTTGYIVYLTADVEVTRNDDNVPVLMWRTQRNIVTTHTLNQTVGMPIPDGYSKYIYKWHNPNIIETPKGYSLLFINPINRFNLPFQTITGIVDSDMHLLPVHFPFFIKDDFTGIIPEGTPITQIIPIKRDAWEREYKSYDEDTIQIKIEKYFSTIKRAYKTKYWERKNYK